MLSCRDVDGSVLAMRLAPIVPPGCEDLLPLDAMTHVMAFADIALLNVSYARFYRGLRARGVRVVMDNQIYEGQEPLAPIALAGVLSMVQPHLAIIPDFRGSARETLQMAHRYHPILDEFVPPTVNLCGVVQGRTLKECTESVEMWQRDFPNLKYLAVPIRHPSWEGSRAQVWLDVVRPRLQPGQKVHFLGAEKWPYVYEHLAGRDDPLIESLDTAEPTSATLANFDLAMCTDGETRRPPEFMIDPYFKVTLQEREELLCENIETLQDYLAMQGAFAGGEMLSTESSSLG